MDGVTHWTILIGGDFISNTVYSIYNKINNCIYIGATSDYSRRISEHVLTLKRNVHHSYRLQKDFNTHGESSFIFKELERGAPEETKFIREQYWMDKYESYDVISGYNISPTAGTTKGRRHTEEAKAKMSETHKTMKLSTDHKKAISDSMKGHVKTDEHQRKITEAVRNRDKTLLARGSKVGGALLDEGKAREIIEGLISGVPGVDLARRYGVGPHVISSIRSGRTWRHVAKDMGIEGRVI